MKFLVGKSSDKSLGYIFLYAQAVFQQLPKGKTAPVKKSFTLKNAAIYDIFFSLGKNKRETWVSFCPFSHRTSSSTVKSDK